MTDSPNTAKARAEAIFRKAAEDARSDAMADYRSRQQAEIDKAARLKAMRMARERPKN
jgi:hypothetical protein